MTTKAPSKQAMEVAASIKLYTHWNGGVGDIRSWDDVRADIAAALDTFAVERHDPDKATLFQMAQQRAVEIERLRARNVALVAALKLGLSAIDMDDDMFHIDGVAVAEMEAALAADAKA